MGLIADIGTKMQATAGITSLVSTRTYAEQVPSTVTSSQSYIVYRLASTERPTYIRGATGMADSTVEIACVVPAAAGSAAAEAISDAVRAAFHAQNWTGSSTTVKVGTCVSENSEGDPPQSGQNIGRYVRLLTYRFWHTEAATAGIT